MADNLQADNLQEAKWWDFFKLFANAGREDPRSLRQRTRHLTGAGVTQPDVIPDLRGGEFTSGGSGVVRLRDSNDFIDLSSVTNRISRYKEYERLRNISEIETVMQIFADEACVAGETEVATVEYGYKTIEWLAEHKAGERFAVYCWDFEKQDYTIGWGFNPRVTKTAPTVKVKLDDGTYFICTEDHRILKRDEEWIEAEDLNYGDELMPFYRLPANQHFTKLKTKQFPRIFTFTDGWKHERWFIDEWRTGEIDEKKKKCAKSMRLIGSGLSTEQTAKQVGHQWRTLEKWLHYEGFSWKEIKHLSKKKDRRRVIGVEPWKEMKVYDLSVEKHMNFCIKGAVVHNCQKNDEGHVVKITCNNKKVKEELEFLFYHRDMLNIDRVLWSWAKNLFIFGDFFAEVVINPENPKDGILKLMPLPPESVFRIETTKGKVVEFQQSQEGPDWQALARAPITQATEAELMQSTAIRFHAEQVIHIKVGEDRRTFYPYGVSLIEPARGPAHQLRMMEDAMVVYRLTRAPERRVFYIDVGQLPPNKAEAFMDRMKDQFRKKKVTQGKNFGREGASAVEERWSPMPADEDYWVPIRPNTNTRVETLPGAQNLGEIDDAVYFRNKLYTALHFPKNYLDQEDAGATRITLSAQDVKFARTVERLQAPLEDGLYEVARRHLTLRGFPEEMYDDLELNMTPPSDWRELSRAEVVTNRLNNASNLKGSQLMADYDIYIDWLKLPHDDAMEKLSRIKIQKLEDLKLQIMASNPSLVGLGQPGEGELELGSEPGGPNPMLGGPQPGGPGQDMMGGEGGPGGPPGQDMMGGGGPGEGGGPPEGMGGPPGPDSGEDQEQGPQLTQKGNAAAISDPTDEDIKKYDLEIQDYEAEQDSEDVDYSEV